MLFDVIDCVTVVWWLDGNACYVGILGWWFYVDFSYDACPVLLGLRFCLVYCVCLFGWTVCYVGFDMVFVACVLDIVYLT